MVMTTLVALFLGQYLAFGTLQGDHLLVASLLATANVLEILLVSFTIRRYLPVVAGEASGYLRLGRVLIGASLAGCVASTMLAVVAHALAPDSALLETSENWFPAHLLGMVIVGMFTLVVFRERGRVFGTPGTRMRMLRDVLLLTAVTIGVFAQTRYPLLFTVFAPLLFLVFRYGSTGLVVGVTILTLVTNMATAFDVGPFSLIPHTTVEERTLIAQVYLGVICLVAVPVMLALGDRQRLSGKVAESERLYRLLAEYASDLVVRMASDGARRYVSPSVKELLGWTPEQFAAQGVEAIHPDDRERVAAVIGHLRRTGESKLVRYRVRNRAGGYHWFEGLGKLAPSPDRAGEIELVYSARDITARVLTERALANSEGRLRAITDAMPAIIAHVDAEQRYTFVNAFAGEVNGVEAASIIGHTVMEVRGPDVYAVLKPHIELALRGTTTTFEYDVKLDGQTRYFQANYLPARTGDGTPNGFYALNTEITRIKLAEQQLHFLAHHDALTGIPNRLTFQESVQLAVQRSAITHEPLLLMMIDVDHFKQINDTYGHAAGDTVLSEVATRLSATVRKTDLLARLGGDEFVILCPNIEDIDTARNLAQKITDAMQRPASLGHTEINVTLSIGVALCRDTTSADALEKRADEALYQAKEAGRACFRIATDGV